jgi:hypothetical protein
MSVLRERASGLDSLDVTGVDAVDVDTHVGPLHSETFGEHVGGALRGLR